MYRSVTDPGIFERVGSTTTLSFQMGVKLNGTFIYNVALIFHMSFSCQGYTKLLT